MSDGLLDVRNLAKNFGGLRAVDDCSFSIVAGSITALIGPNGAGKTTVFNLISGLLRPDGGEIHFRGERVDGLRPHGVSQRGITRTFQIPRELERLTVLENVLLYGKGQSGERLGAALFTRPRFWREERTLVRRAEEILGLVQLAELSQEYAAAPVGWTEEAARAGPCPDGGSGARAPRRAGRRGVLMGLLEGTRFLKDLVPAISGVRLAALRLMFVGVLLIVFMMFRPEGLWKEEKQSPA